MSTQICTIDKIDYKELSKTCKDENDLSSLTKQFMKNMIENMLKAEIEEHIQSNEGLSKNGYYKKTVKSGAGELELDIPRDKKSRLSTSDYPKRQNHYQRYRQ